MNERGSSTPNGERSKGSGSRNRPSGGDGRNSRSNRGQKPSAKGPNKASNKPSNNHNNSDGSGPSRKRKKGRKKPRLDPIKYWGDPGVLPVRHDYALESDDPTAIIRSLGKAPIPGKNSAPELYFELLYQRAAGLAQALAFAGGINEGPESADSELDAEPNAG